MLFRRRTGLPWWRKLVGWLWPSSGFKRAGQYLWHRIARLPGTAHSIAAGVAAGASVSFTPFIGLHFLMGFALAWLTRGNLVASAIGTAVGNPWTFPFIFTLTGQVGTLILGEHVSGHVPSWSWDALFDAPITYLSSFLPVVFPLIVGGIPVAVIVWLLFYFSFKGLLTGYRSARQIRLQEKKRTSGSDASQAG
ncbi:DUF2062 domain-containing protein [Kordiimonas sp.]|uniref:DUF2062 domain-containing protein n=1 Tax=Kordiimonas sp. TaxID=1970157 RepID=UPI003A931575